jgi:hypothetical protein
MVSKISPSYYDSSVRNKYAALCVSTLERFPGSIEAQSTNTSRGLLRGLLNEFLELVIE